MENAQASKTAANDAQVPSDQSEFRSADRSLGTVLVAGFSDHDQSWAEKWMVREALNCQFINDADEAAQYCLETPPNVLICPATALCQDDLPLYAFVRKEIPYANISCIAIAGNDKEIELAMDWQVADIARRPAHWNIISHRAAILLENMRIRSELLDTQVRMREAQRLASNADEHLHQLEEIDGLTKLPTAHKFLKLISGATAQNSECLVFSIGIDRFHLINDTYGREIGNELLIKFAAVLRELLLKSDLYAKTNPSVLAACAAKLDGVRFGLMVPHDGTDEHERQVRKFLTTELTKPFEINKANIYLPTSIGGAVTTRHGRSSVNLIRSAERAMNEVKRKGGGFGFYQEDNQLSSARQLQLDGWLREAIARDELKVFYQPLVNMWNNQIVGAEALLRWQREDGTNISPAEFIPVAELNGGIVQIGEFVINQACAELRRWNDLVKEDMRMAINLSVTQLRRGNVVRSLEQAMQTYQIAPGQLEMEISERGDIGSDQRIIRQLHEIKAIGVRLSLDDFGTGDTAIEYLKKLPIDILKLDRSYVSGALENGADSVITSALITLARNMNLTVIAEGIESKEQYELLRSWKCHLYQGYYCSPAVSGDEFVRLLEKSNQSLSKELSS